MYEDEDYTPETAGAGGSGGRSTRNSVSIAAGAASGPANGHEDRGAESDDEGDGLLRSTAHIWREPLQHYILSLHARRRQVEQAVEEDEASRKFLIAARATDMAEKRLPIMLERKEIRMTELKLEEAARARKEEEERARMADEEEKRQAREREKEERLKKQRDAARKRREEERLKKEHDNELRKQRAEEVRLAKIAEAERRANLTPEERAAEDKLMAEKIAKEKAEARSRVKPDEDELLASGRGARQRRRPEGLSAEDEAARALAAFGGYDDDYDDFDDDEIDEYEGGGPRRKGKGRRRSSSSFSDPGFVLPPGAYRGPDGMYYDASGQPLSYTAPDSPMAMDEELDEVAGGSEGLEKRKPQQIAELEKKIWLQIARKDIPKVRVVALSYFPL